MHFFKLEQSPSGGKSHHLSTIFVDILTTFKRLRQIDSFNPGRKTNHQSGLKITASVVFVILLLNIVDTEPVPW